MKNHKAITLITFFLLIPLLLIGIVKSEEELTDNSIANKEVALQSYQGYVVEIPVHETVNYDGVVQLHQTIKVKITNGDLYGEIITVENGDVPLAQVQEYFVGDKVIVSYGQDVAGDYVGYIIDYDRTESLIILVVVFVILAVGIGTKKSVASIAALVISFVILFAYTIPALRTGTSPIVVSSFTSFLVIPVIFYMSHGFNKETSIAVIGTLVSLIVTSLIAQFFINLTHLSGNASDESMFLINSGSVIYDLRGILLAGIIIGTLGVLDDITVTQVSIVSQIYEVKKSISFIDLYKRAINVGRDHIASLINTLILVYAGASLPLLLLFVNLNRPSFEIINMELVSTEIVRTLVGSIGLIIAVPITTYIACYYVTRKK